MRWRVLPEQAGERLDRHLAARLEQPRNQVQRWIRDGRVRVDGATATKLALALPEGAWIECEPPTAAPPGRLEPESGELRIVYCDPDLVVLDKPPGITVHPGAGQPTGTLAHRLLARFPEIATVGGPGRPGIVHRLDKGTSGLLAVARTPAAYQHLAAAFAGRQVQKTYLAIVYGVPRHAAGTIEAPIGRHPSRRKEMTVRASGRPARTSYRRRAAAGGLSLLELDLHTGRTHQIRVHLKHLGHPLVGDPVYGEARFKGLPKMRQAVLQGFARPALHAWRLALPHPRDGRRLALVAPPPADLRELWTGATGSPWPLPDEPEARS